MPYSLPHESPPFFVGGKHLLPFAMGCGAETASSLLAAAAAAVASQICLGVVCLFKTRKLPCQTAKESNSHLHHVGARLLENSLSETGVTACCRDFIMIITSNVASWISEVTITTLLY